MTIRTYLIRRRVLGLTQGENKNIVTLSKNIESLSRGETSLIQLLGSQFYRLRLPNDTEMKNALSSMNFYQGLKQYSKLILGKIEEKNSKVSIDFRNKKVNIEHIMPQKLEKSWKSELGDNFEYTHNTYLHNIGNLILTEFNSEMGNKSFDEKKNKLATSSLYYRLDIINRDTWNEDSIKDHQKKMIGWFLDAFPLPEDYKENSNWNIQLLETTSFSPLDSDAGEMAEGNKPSELRINGSRFKVKTWQDVFIQFLKYLKESPSYDFEFILDNQTELFRRDEIIIKWSSLKELIDAKKDLSTRYKTFEGKVWDRTKVLNDELLFIHINISASACMTRIGNIMEKFNISEDSVEIILK